jgi:hypothetical protein
MSVTATTDPVVAIRETLDAVVSPTVRAKLIADALKAWGAREVPSDPAAFTEFVAGPLRRALVRGLGDALADSILAELEVTCMARAVTERPPAVAALSSRPSSAAQSSPPGYRAPLRSGAVAMNTRAPLEDWARLLSPARVPQDLGEELEALGELEPRERPSELTLRTVRTLGSGFITSGGTPQRASARLPALNQAVTVFLVTEEERRMHSLEEWLRERSLVVVAPDLLTLLEGLRCRPGRKVIVLDCTHPQVRPLTLAALEDELPVGTQVVLFGVGDAEHRALLAFNPRTAEWIRLGSQAPRELAVRCAGLFR